jgi:hypothetical protein
MYTLNIAFTVQYYIVLCLSHKKNLGNGDFSMYMKFAQIPYLFLEYLPVLHFNYKPHFINPQTYHLLRN